MKYFPIFLDANYIDAIIIGGGEVAARKIELLLKATTNITVMAETLNENVRRLVNEHQLNWLAHNYQQGYLDNYNLVIAATDNSEINNEVAQEGNELAKLTNIVDQPQVCNYITPAIIDRAPMLIAMSSSGNAPILLRMLREEIEKNLPNDYGKLAEFSFKFRDHVKARIKNIRDRRLFWEQVLRGQIGQHILEGDTQLAEQQLFNSLKQQTPPPVGEIVFVYNADGDPDNLTLKAHRAMQFADAVFYDSQINLDFIEYIRRDASKFPQAINSNIMINVQHALDLAQQGEKIIYLLAGDEPIPKNNTLAQSQILQQHLYCGH